MGDSVKDPASRLSRRANLREARDFCGAIVDNPLYRENFVRRAVSGELHPSLETMIWHYAKGKPRTEVRVTLPKGIEDLPDKDLMALATAAFAKPAASVTGRGES